MADHKTKDFYELLGVAREASPDQIKIAYRDLARVYHPDSNFYAEIIDAPLTPRDEEIFKLVTAAYDTLMDPEKRAAYDRTLLKGVPGWTEAGPNSHDTFEPAPRPPHWEQMKKPSKPSSPATAPRTFGTARREDYVSMSAVQRARPVADFLQSTKRTIADRVLLFVGFGLPLLTLAAVAIYLFWFAKKT